MESILSIGIDIGTCTTSMILSRITIENTASCFSVPRISIIDKEVIYKSNIYFTPLINKKLIDIKKLEEIIKCEYNKAGIRPCDLHTGAVIITGESSRKENAALVNQKLSDVAGDFVVATAGPDLESIIAAKGSGAQKYSKVNNCVVANLDIGGGTTNIAIFNRGDLVGKGCLDIGGRLIVYNDEKNISYISESIYRVAKESSISLAEGDKLEEDKINKICELMANIMLSSLLGERSYLKTQGSSEININNSIDCISFSGGVADYIYSKDENLYKYNDIGIFLANSIRNSKLYNSFKLIEPKETIRATVVGAGTFTTSVSGSTVMFSHDEIFPIKSIPAFALTELVEKNLLIGNSEKLEEELIWFLKQTDSSNVIFVLKNTKNPTYGQVCNIGEVLSKIGEKYIDSKEPILVLTENDFSKSLGQVMKRKVCKERQVVCIDNVIVEDGDYIDMGKPLMGGMVIPVVVKTLIYG